jgi:hypothetical protein
VPVPQVRVAGAKAGAAAAGYHENYSGRVPIASDTGWAAGSGNGSAYVRGPIEVAGVEDLGLAADGVGGE